jgi:methionyl-tRNA synthetase
MITYDDFKKLQMQVGTVRCVEPVEGADKLLRCEIDFGALEVEPVDMTEEAEGHLHVVTDIQPVLDVLPFDKEEYCGRDVRQIVSGIREFYPDYEKLVGKQLLYVTNLEPRTIRGVESHGMLMAVDGIDGNPVFLIPEILVDAGSNVR